MLCVEHISFRYSKSKKDVLKDISFSMKPGEVLCVLGPNGTGKSTLLHCLLGLSNPASGRLLWKGKDMKSFSIRKRAKCMAYVPQSSDLSFPYEVHEVILMGRIAHLGIGGALSRKDHQIVDEIMNKLGISAIKNSIFQNLSGGEKQMVLIARAMAQQASLMILDEPTANLDFANQVSALKMIKELSHDGYTILMISHSPDHAFLAADRVIMLRDGFVYADGRPDDVINDHSLTELYGVGAAVCSANILSTGKTTKVCIPLIEG